MAVGKQPAPFTVTDAVVHGRDCGRSTGLQLSSTPLMPDIVERALIAAVSGRGTIRRVDYASGTAIEIVPAVVTAASMWFKLSPNEDEVWGTLGRNTPIEISVTEHDARRNPVWRNSR
jgi:hypothetical protein